MLDLLKSRLAGRGDSEHEQAALRIVIVGLVLAYMALFHGAPSRWSSGDWTIILVLSAFFATAIAIFVAICIWPGKNVPRRLLGMLADNGGATWYMWLAGEYGFSMIGVFLFVAFGNGFRYGRRYLFGSQALCLVGYVCVLAFVPFWFEHRSAGYGLLIALIVLPVYVSTLLRRIHEARSKAEEANLAKTSFLANMSHEMRTPLNGIVGVVDLLKTTALSQQQGELVGLLRHSISVLRSLVDDVLDITKIEAGRLTIEVAPFDLHICINGLIQLLHSHAQAKGLALRAVVDPALEYRLRGDSHHLRQILLNLLSNAIKFTERGEVNLGVSLKQETVEGVTARFEVKDTGIGIAPEALSKIFERFVQADQSTTRKYGGTGLGTTIAKQLVELMGGNIGVESKLGEGSTFWIELPLLRDAAFAQVEPSHEASGLGDSRGTGVSLVIGARGSGNVIPALRTLGEAYEVMPSAASVGPRIDQIRGSGGIVRAVVAACPVDQACVAFNVTIQRLQDVRAALIYIADGEISIVDKARVNSFNGACALEYATPRLIANAIHAATAGVDGSIAGGADLAMVLGLDRAALKILVADDNATNQRIVRQLLESAGYEIVVASDGEEALDVYEAEHPDLAILDFNMPQRSGIEVIQAIRMMEPTGVRMPAVILSASVTPEARERASRAGADEFIGKPFDAASLVQQIDRLGKRTSRAKDGSAPRVPKAQTQMTGSNADDGANRAERVAPTNRSTTQSTLVDSRLLDGARLAQLEDIARDDSFLAELVDGFISDVDAILAKTSRAVATANSGLIPDLMHTLKGAAVGVGASQLASLATEFDEAAPTASAQEVRVKLNQIISCFEATSVNLKLYLQGQHHA